jgi:hypothetical protein
MFFLPFFVFLALYVDLIKLIFRLKKDWIFSYLICLHGTHSNGIEQGPISGISLTNLFMENQI